MRKGCSGEWCTHDSDVIAEEEATEAAEADDEEEGPIVEEDTDGVEEAVRLLDGGRVDGSGVRRGRGVRGEKRLALVCGFTHEEQPETSVRRRCDGGGRWIASEGERS